MSIEVLRFDALDSTNEEAKRQAMGCTKGRAAPLWITTPTQTSGRGRRGNLWVSDTGNLFASLLLPLENPTTHSAALSFTAALSVADSLAAYTDEAVALKWPNDVLLGGRKAAGILLETAGPHAVVIGIGMNLASYPENTEFPATSLAARMGQVPSAEAALDMLMRHWDAWFAAWQAKGFLHLRDAWLARAAQLGGPVRARLATATYEGVFEDIDDDGALMLREPGGNLTRVTAGEVFF